MSKGLIKNIALIVFMFSVLLVELIFIKLDW